MSFKPTNEMLIDFVYGNLPEASKAQVEEAIKQDATLKQEVDELIEARTFLGRATEEEVLMPEQFSWATGKKGNASFLWPVIGVAASITVMLLVGYFTRFSISYGAFNLGFGQPQPAVQPLSAQQVKSMINAAITTNNIHTVAQINGAKKELQSEFETQLAANTKLQRQDMYRIAASAKELPKEEIQGYLAQLSENNRTMINDFFATSALKQQEYMNTILTDFYAFVDHQRKQDLQLIQASLNELDYKNEIKTKQTDQILANIITTVNNGSMGQ